MVVVPTVKLAGGEMFTEPRVVLLDLSFAIVTVKFCGLTAPLLAGFVTATCTVKFFFEGAAWADATATTEATSAPKTPTPTTNLEEPNRFIFIPLPAAYDFGA
ncbi:MAG: hypothetical protein ACXVQZ_07440 [Gaiellaceae bacterium]